MTPYQFSDGDYTVRMWILAYSDEATNVVVYVRVYLGFMLPLERVAGDLASNYVVLSNDSRVKANRIYSLYVADPYTRVAFVYPIIRVVHSVKCALYNGVMAANQSNLQESTLRLTNNRNVIVSTRITRRALRNEINVGLETSRVTRYKNSVQ